MKGAIPAFKDVDNSSTTHHRKFYRTRGRPSLPLRQRLFRQLPYGQEISNRYQQLPSHYKYGCFLCWIAYKVLTLGLFAFIFHNHILTTTTTSSSTTTSDPKGIGIQQPTQLDHVKQQRSLVTNRLRHERTSDLVPTDMTTTTTTTTTKILYIVTSLAEYNTGRRNTIAGQDRLGEVVLPILVDSINTILINHPQYHVDVYLILAYTLRPHREYMIRSQLPPQVGLQIWDDACPLGYDTATQKMTQIHNNTRALARQHRYVIKDKLPYYDLFVAFEDDMRITGTHIQHYLTMSNEIEILRQQIKRDIISGGISSTSTTTNNFFGALTLRQMDRFIPGFVRVEVLLNEDENGAQLQLDPIPLDYSYNNNDDKAAADSTTTNLDTHFDPQPCCHVQMHSNINTTGSNIPATPRYQDVILWETTVQALSVRQLPASRITKDNTEAVLDWVTFLPGPGKRLGPDDMVDSYWSGSISKNNVWKKRPSPGQPELIAQQGGWMATKEQIIRLNYQPKTGDDINDSNKNDIDQTILCQGSFLPPFDTPVYRSDGQESMNVEFWSGGYQLFTGVKGGCNMLRIVSMKPEHFSKHFIYHVANNKQKQLSRQRMVRADHLWAQLNSVRKAAIIEKEHILQH